MVATSLSRKKRSLTRRLIALRLSSEVNWPLTRTLMRSGPACDDAGGRDRVLRLQRRHDRLLVEAEAAILRGREFEIDHLVLRADDVDLADIGHRQHLGADVLDVVAQLALRQPVAGEGVDVAEDVAEAVVEERPDHAVAGTRP